MRRRRASGRTNSPPWPARRASRSCCRPTRRRRRRRWRPSPRPASPATPPCPAAPARFAHWSITPPSRSAAGGRRGRRAALARAFAEAGPVLTEIDAGALLAPYGIRRPPEALATSAEAAVAAAARIGGAVALKVHSPDILHKTEAGAVALGIVGEAAVRAAYQRVVAAAAAAHPQARIDGVLVQQMAPPGVEMILGITRDPDFGPLLMVGLGGIHVEVLRDVAFAPVPIAEEEALALLGTLRGAALLNGVRGGPPA